MGQVAVTSFLKNYENSLKNYPTGKELSKKKYLQFLLDRHQLIRIDAGYSAGTAFWKPTVIPCIVFFFLLDSGIKSGLPTQMAER